MAISLAGTPIGGSGKFNPVYNPVVWYFGSGLTMLPGFRYVVDVFERTGPSTQELITRLEIPPRPSDGLCVADIGQILSNYVTNQNPTDNLIDAFNSYMRYNLEVREKYLVSYGWSSFQPATGSTGFPTFTQINFDVPTPFQINDQITNFTSDNEYLEGILTVIDVITDQEIVVNREYSIVTTGGTSGVGDAIFTDGRKFLSPVGLTSGDNTVWNGALAHTDLVDYDAADYAISASAPGKFLSYIPQSGFRVREATVLNLLAYISGTSGRRIVISDGTTVKFRSIPGTPIVANLPVGPGNINEAGYTLLAGPSASITTCASTTGEYEVWIATSGMVQVSQKYKFVLDCKCTKWDEYQLVFMDRLGSLASFSFYYLSQKSQSVSRTENTYPLGDLGAGATSTQWGFSPNDTGRRLTNVDIENSIRLNTAWLTNDEAEYFQQLVSSPKVWINKENQLFPVIVQDTSSVTNDKRATKNIRYEINVSMANRDTINW